MAPPTTTYHISYVTEYGETPETVTFSGNWTITIHDLPTISCEGAEFLGWYYENDVQVQVDDVVTADTTLYAKWNPNIVTIYEPRLHAIADAIRLKNNTSEEYRPKDMAMAIQSLDVANGSAVGTVTASSSGASLLVNTLDFTPSNIIITLLNVDTVTSSPASSFYAISLKYDLTDGLFALGCYVYGESSGVTLSDISSRLSLTLLSNGFQVNSGTPPAYMVPGATYAYIAF